MQCGSGHRALGEGKEGACFTIGRLETKSPSKIITHELLKAREKKRNRLKQKKGGNRGIGEWEREGGERESKGNRD